MTSVNTRARVLGDNAQHARNTHLNPWDFKATESERLNFVMGSLVGHVVVVKTKDGKEFEGILKTGWWKMDQADSPTGVELLMARPLVALEQLSPKPVESMVILKADFVRMSAPNADLYNDELTEAARRKGGDVLADSEIEIAGGRSEFGAERELVMASAWLGDEELGGLEAPGGGKVQRGWDQFAVNERLGAKSTYNDELYTTKISDKKFSAEQLRKAERLAKEIEKKESTNAHVLEERGMRELSEAMDGDMDEEDKYSMVLGTGRTPGQPMPAEAPPPAATAASATIIVPDATPATPAPKAAEPAGAPEATGLSVPSSKLNAKAKEFVPGQFGPKPVSSPAGGPPGPPSGSSPAQPIMSSYMGSPQQHMVAHGMQPAMVMGPGHYMHPGMAQQPGGGYMIPPMMVGGMAPQQAMHPSQQHALQQQHMLMQQQAQAQQQQMQRGGMAMPMGPPSPGMVMVDPRQMAHGMMPQQGMMLPVTPNGRQMMGGGVQMRQMPGAQMAGVRGMMPQAGGYGMAPQGMRPQPGYGGPPPQPFPPQQQSPDQ